MSEPMIEPALRQILATATGVYRVVDDRIYFCIRPQNEERPCVVLTVIDKVHPHTHEGSAGFTQGRIQIDAFAPTYQQAKELAKAIRDAIDDRSGWSGGVVVDYIEIESEQDIPVVIPTGKAAPSTYGVSLDAVFQHQNEE